MYNLTEEKKQELINEYLTTRITVSKLCEKYNIKITEFFILQTHKNFHKDKSLKIKRFWKRKKECNENFFENLDIEDSAYWAGFILGDGCLTNNSLRIGLSIVDLNHLKKFQKNIKSEYLLSSTSEKCNTSICRPKLIEDLTKHGITKDKSKHCVIPKSLSENMLHHFMRGLFDADGSFYIDKLNKSAHFSVCSSVESFLEEYQQILMKECDLNKTKIRDIRKNGKCYEFAYCGNLQVKRIMDYLYKDATIYLERKFNKFHEFYNNKHV